MNRIRTFLSIIALLILTQAHAQWTSKTMSFGGLTRQYRLYVSPNYNAGNPASIVMTLHGLGDNMTNFSNLGFAQIGDTANVIVICPQAVSDVLAGTAWNSGAGMMGYYPNSSVNDIGFLNALVDTTMANYSVNPQKVYLCGFSMGGFMTYRMAIQSNEKFAAFASMSGTIGSAITSFNPGRTIPIAHFHGTADGMVAFTGNQYGLDPDSVISLWISNNSCGVVPTDTFQFPDVHPADSITVELFEYRNGNPNADVNFYIMYGADHNVLFPYSNDIDEPLEVWKFFRTHFWASAGMNKPVDQALQADFFPNPAADFITLITNGSGNTDIYDLSGKLLISQNIDQAAQIIDISALNPGMYILVYLKDQSRISRKLIVE